ncbi:hypothetical protein DXD42_05015 [Collinsella sp. TM04-9]|nr:hypothetical protein DXD42_05015 [Collinsella sp. TM04-9]RGJ94566.1 hypothetical protein DXD39_00580 [Collinsella sp. TM04-29]RHJ26196.1 hypothetical protein DW136_04735 [Collinsella sp. AM12-1]
MRPRGNHEPAAAFHERIAQLEDRIWALTHPRKSQDVEEGLDDMIADAQEVVAAWNEDHARDAPRRNQGKSW